MATYTITGRVPRSTSIISVKTTSVPVGKDVVKVFQALFLEVKVSKEEGLST